MSADRLIIETRAEKLSVVEEDAPKREQPHLTSGETNLKPQTTGLSALDKIRKQFKGNGNGNGDTLNLPLQQEQLQKAWNDYIYLLKEKRNPAAQPCELALLRIKDDNSFEAVTANNIEQKFIEQERNHLFHFLQEKLHNRLLQFTVIVEENSSDRPVIEVTMTSKEQFQKMTEEFPLVKELKDRLRLELDY